MIICIALLELWMILMVTYNSSLKMDDVLLTKNHCEQPRLRGIYWTDMLQLNQKRLGMIYWIDVLQLTKWDLKGCTEQMCITTKLKNDEKWEVVSKVMDN